MVSAYNAEVVLRTLRLLDIRMSELFICARESEKNDLNSLIRGRRAKKDYESFKDGIYPDYLIAYCEKMIAKHTGSHSNVRNLSARRSGVPDLNAHKKPKQ